MASGQRDSASSLSSFNPTKDVPELCRLSAAELTSLYQRREISPVEVVQQILAQAEKIQTSFNAFVLIDHNGALSDAKRSESRWLNGTPLGPLDGVPVTIKDLISTKGWPLRLGSQTTSSSPVVEDAPSSKALRNGGAIFIASTTTPEFGWKGVADSPLYGVTRNPWNPELTSGGSSGGAAVAALTGCGVLHLGSDGGGSIRIPASFTGVFGHKPSFGRVPYFPPSAFGNVGHLGPITRTVEDAALMLEAMSVRDIRDWLQNPLSFASVIPVRLGDWTGRRVGLWSKPAAGTLDPEVLDITMKVARHIETLGAVVESISLPEGDLLSPFNILWFAGAASRVRRIPREQHDKLDPGLLRTAEIGESYSAVDFVNASTFRATFGIDMDALLDQYDFIISPATNVTAFAAGHDVPPASDQSSWTEWAGFNFPINLSQQPACSVPVGLTKAGLPVGVQIVGAKGRDDRVLAAAASLIATLRGDTLQSMKEMR